MQAFLNFLEKFGTRLTRIQRGKLLPKFQHGKLGAGVPKGFLGSWRLRP
jgi:hypothetical protein